MVFFAFVLAQYISAQTVFDGDQIRKHNALEYYKCMDRLAVLGMPGISQNELGTVFAPQGKEADGKTFYLHHYADPNLNYKRRRAKNSKSKEQLRVVVKKCQLAVKMKNPEKAVNLSQKDWELLSGRGSRSLKLGQQEISCKNLTHSQSTTVIKRQLEESFKNLPKHITQKINNLYDELDTVRTKKDFKEVWKKAHDVYDLKTQEVRRHGESTKIKAARGFSLQCLEIQNPDLVRKALQAYLAIGGTDSIVKKTAKKHGIPRNERDFYQRAHTRNATSEDRERLDHFREIREFMEFSELKTVPYEQLQRKLNQRRKPVDAPSRR